LATERLIGLANTAIKSNFVKLDKPYKLNFCITYWCQSRCLTCVKPDEIVLGDNAPISDLKIGGYAIGSTGLNEIKQTFSRMYSGEMIRIKATGLLPFEITPEHPILVTSSKTTRHRQLLDGVAKYSRTYEFGEPVWKPAKDLLTKDSFKDGDYLCTPVLKGDIKVKTLSLKRFNKGRGVAISKAKGVPLEFPLNEETAWLLGIYTAEGCPASNGARFTLNIKETTLHKKIIRIGKKLGYSVSYYKQRGKCIGLCLSSHVISRAFSDWCGKGAMNKKMPDFILLNKNPSILKEFLKGWEDGDGYWKDEVFIGSTISKTLALQLQLAYTSLGLHAKISHVRKEKGKFNGRIVNFHDAYVIAYSKDPKIRYSRRVGDYILHPIRAIEKVPYEGIVHNIETGDNTYLVSNAVVHNCNIWQIKPKGELTIDEVREFAKKNTYFKWVELTGGEPFLRGDIVEIAKAFKENSKELYILTMPTNSLCNQDMVERKLREILALGIPRIAITVSLDGYRELHDKIRGTPGNYDRAIAMFKRLKEMKKEYSNLFFVFGYTLSKFNKGEFEKTYEAVKSEIPDIRYNDFHINLAQVSTNYYGNGSDDIKANNAEVVGELESILKHREFQLGIIPIIETAFTRKLVEYAKTGTSPMKSRSLEASLFMDSYGNVYPSIMWDTKIGNIRDTSYDLLPLWHNDQAKSVREAIKEGREPNQWTSCEAYQMLTGNIISLLI